MKVWYVVRLAKEYLALGAAAGILFFAIALLGYLWVFRRKTKEERNIPWRKMLCSAIVACYFAIVIGATMLSRNVYVPFSTELQLFSTYKEAWYSFSMVDWRNIILNICMFIPIGFLLPFTSNIFKSWWKCYFMGFLFTLLIETSQFFIGCGVFESDDLFGNTLGAMIGFGIYQVLQFVVCLLKKDKKNIGRVLAFQIPLCAVICMFSGIYIVYQMQEFGNLTCQNVTQVDLSKTEIVLQEKLYDWAKPQMINRLHIATKEETLELATKLFANGYTEIDLNQITYYDDKVRYRNKENNCSIWITYQGSCVEYENYAWQVDSQGNPSEKKEDADDGQIREAIEKLGLHVPEKAEFVNVGNGAYHYNVPYDTEGNGGLSGVIDCVYTANDEISSMKYLLIETDPYKECEIYTQQEAYEKLLSGCFYDTLPKKAPKILEIKSVNSVLYIDSKGFYQPVYSFRCLCDGENIEIYIPALKHEK